MAVGKRSSRNIAESTENTENAEDTENARRN